MNILLFVWLLRRCQSLGGNLNIAFNVLVDLEIFLDYLSFDKVFYSYIFKHSCLVKEGSCGIKNETQVLSL